MRARLLRLIPLLTDPAGHGANRRDAFDVIVPSLPGFGFSDRPTQPGMSNFRITELWASLMDGLGYPRYGSPGRGASGWPVAGAKEGRQVATTTEWQPRRRTRRPDATP